MSSDNLALPGILEETDEQFHPTGVEATDEPERARSKPYDPELIRVDPKTFSLRQVLDMIEENDIDIAPNFQRLKVWKSFQKSRLVESILLRIPLPAFYFSANQQGIFQVVDGIQRLSTIYDFIRKDAFALQELEYLKELNGKTYSELCESPIWPRRMNNTQLFVNVIDPQTPSEVKFDIFKRINTGGTPLNDQEIRHCLSQPQTREFLTKLAESDIFKKATGNVFEGGTRMVDREVVLRFIAFRFVPGYQEYSKAVSMAEFLNAANKWLDDRTKAESEGILESFENAMCAASLVFGEHAFRKWKKGDTRLNPFNRALFDVWSVLLADVPNERVRDRSAPLVERAQILMSENQEFIDAISASTGDPARVESRFRLAKEALQAALS